MGDLGPPIEADALGNGRTAGVNRSSGNSSVSEVTGLVVTPYPRNSGSYSRSSWAGIVDVSSMSLLGAGFGEAGDSITTVSVSPSVGVGGSGDVGESTIRGVKPKSDVVYTSTTDGAGGGDAVSHSMSPQSP